MLASLRLSVAALVCAAAMAAPAAHAAPAGTVDATYGGGDGEAEVSVAGSRLEPVAIWPRRETVARRWSWRAA